MTDEERRFKVLKVEKYEEQLEKMEFPLIVDTLLCGGLAVGAVAVLCASGDLIPITVPISMIAGNVAALKLKNMIQFITKKTLLESKIDDINFELENEEKEEQRGKSL